MESTTLTINNQAFEHLKTRTYRGVSIYRGSESFLRIGPHKEINRERNDHTHLLSQHFPVAHILEYGEYRDQAYYIEESLGTQTISDLFIEDTEKKWAISSLHFESFLALIERLTRAQIQSREVQAKSVTDFAHGILIEQLISEKPDWTDRIHALFTQIQNRLSVFPSVFVQGDCNPRNLFPKGIIDFDAGFIGPL